MGVNLQKEFNSSDTRLPGESNKSLCSRGMPNAKSTNLRQFASKIAL